MGIAISLVWIRLEIHFADVGSLPNHGCAKLLRLAQTVSTLIRTLAICLQICRYPKLDKNEGPPLQPVRVSVVTVGE